MIRAALITPPGPAGIAVVRVEGDKLRPLLEAVFEPVRRQEEIIPGHVMLGVIRDANVTIDQVLVVLQSQNGQEAVEINCHGGPRVVQRILMLLEKQGVAAVSWEQLANGQTIAEEVLQTLPLATTELACRAVAYQHPRGLSEWAQRVREKLQQTPPALDTVLAEIRKLLPTYALMQKLLTPPHVLILGAVNTGKSTLANALTGQPQSLVSDTPGTTRDWTAQLTHVQGIPIQLIDTAGHRESSDPLEQAGIGQIRGLLGQAAVILLVHDITQPQTYDYDFKLPPAAAVVHVYNKADLPEKLPAIPQPGIVISARNTFSLEPLRRGIAEALGFADFSPSVPLIFTRRQYEVLCGIVENPANAAENLLLL